jgi:D-alanyl-D-alanine carboxypeptidase
MFIEALERAGVKVNTNLIGPNPSEKLPPENSSTPDTQVAELVSLPYSEYSKMILKVSYNIGSDTSLVLCGLTKGVSNMKDALAVERRNSIKVFGIPANKFHFVDGRGETDRACCSELIYAAAITLIKWANRSGWMRRRCSSVRGRLRCD